MLRAVLVCGVALAAIAVCQSGPSPDLVGAPPLLGRATPDGVTLTLHGGSRPLRVALALELDGQPLALAFPEEGPAPVPGGGRRVIARPDAAAPNEVHLGVGEYLELVVQGLLAGREYSWVLRTAETATDGREGAALRRQEFRGRFVTVRPRGSRFRFVVFGDPHFFVPALEPRLPPELRDQPLYQQYALQSLQWFRQTRDKIVAEFRQAAAGINADRPDFVLGLGDHFDLHGLDFNAAFLTPAMAEEAHAETRRQLALLRDAGALYQVIGNWEGESGDHAPEHRAFAIDARKRFQVNPRPGTSDLGGSPDEDYYAFRWGDVLLVVLNVRGYTRTRHLLGASAGEGQATDFTLGERQREFLAGVLATSDLPYKVVAIHHVVGGKAGDAANSNYGRGGGQAAQVGEQAWVHGLMQQHGVQVLFYGHDHVFTDIVVDGIHYTLPGTTSAPWRFGTEETGYQEWWPQSGYGRVDVTPERLQVELVASDGEVLHSYQVKPRRE